MNTHHHACSCGAPDCAPESAMGTGLAALPRRRFLTGGAAGAMALAAGGAVLAPLRAAAQSSLTPDAALAQMMAGNARFMTKKLDSFQEDLDILRQGTSEKQEPFAAVLSCADSRVPVEIVFDQSIGHVFVARVAGNVVDPEIIGSLEYGAAVLGTRAIMVLGHEGCGAVQAAIAGKAVPGQISALYRPLRPAVEQAGPDLVATIKANARIQADLLATASPVIADMIKQGTVKVVAAYYALGTGQVTLLA